MGGSIRIPDKCKAYIMGDRVSVSYTVYAVILLEEQVMTGAKHTWMMD